MNELEHRDGEPVLIIPIGQILREIQTSQAEGFTRMEDALATKADKSDIHELRLVTSDLGNRVLIIERGQVHEAKNQEQTFTRRQAFWAILIGVGIILSGVLGAILPLIVK